MGSRASTSRVPPVVDEKAFAELCAKEHGGGKKVNAPALFANVCDDDGLVSRDEVLRLSQYRDVLLSYESGIDSSYRYTPDRINKIDKALREHGLLTWLGEVEAAKPGSIHDAEERLRHGVEHSQVVLVFITARYSNLIERTLLQETNINMDAGAGSASADSGEMCSLEFEHAVYCRGKFFLRSIVPCVMEEEMRDPASWGPRLRDLLATRFIIDLSEFEENPASLPDFCTFIASSVGKPLLQGGPFGRDRARALTSTRGRHLRWLREHCGFAQPTARRIADAFEAHGIDSLARLFGALQQDAHYLSRTLGLGEGDEVATLACQIQQDVKSNLGHEQVAGIDKELATKRAARDEAEGLEECKAQSVLSWIRETREDKSMRLEDRRTLALDFDAFVHKVEATRQAETQARRVEAIAYDARLREGEDMAAEHVEASLVREAELQRRRGLAHMCVLQTAREAAEHCRRVAAELSSVLKSGTRPANAVPMPLLGADKLPTLVEQPTDTNWHRLLEEVVHVLHMVRRLCVEKRVEAQQELQDRGVLKVLLLLLHPCCTNTTNMFLIPSPKTRPFLPHRTCDQDAGADPPAHTSISICGVDAIRHLCRCRPDSTDMCGNNDRNIFLLGQAGAIEVVVDIIKLHLRAVKRGNLLKQQFSSLLLGRDPRRAKLVGAPAAPSLLQRRGRGREKLPGMDAPRPPKAGASSFAAMSHTESVERSTQAVYSALECLFSLAGSSAEHPNKARLAAVGALDTLLMCAQIISDSSTVFQWAGRLVVLLFDEHTDKNLNGRLSKMLAAQLKKFVAVASSCAGGCTAIAHLAFVAAKTELRANEADEAVGGTLDGQVVVSQANLAAAAAAAVARVKNDVSYWLRDKNACETCLEAISLHHHHLLQINGDASAAAAVAAGARAVGNLCHHQTETCELFREAEAVRALIDAAKAAVRDHPHVLAELFFAMGNAVTAEAGMAGPGGGKPVGPIPSTMAQGPVSASLFVAGGAVEVLQSGLIYHRKHADVCLTGLFCFSKLLSGVIQARDVALVQRIICIGTCDQVVHAMLAHPTRLDLFLSGCACLQALATSPFDGATGGTQRILRAGASEAVTKGLRTSLSAAQTILSPASVAQSGYTAVDDSAGRNDLLLLSGAAYLIGCHTASLFLKSIRPADFSRELKAQGIVGLLSNSSPARVRAMMLQLHRAHSQGPRVGNFLLAHASIYIQAACDAPHLSALQEASRASTNSPSLYPRRIEAASPLLAPEVYSESLVFLFAHAGISWDDWANGKN